MSPAGSPGVSGLLAIKAPPSRSSQSRYLCPGERREASTSSNHSPLAIGTKASGIVYSSGGKGSCPKSGGVAFSVMFGGS